MTRLATSVQRYVHKAVFLASSINDTVVVGVETPVLKSTNVDNYRKQAGTIILIEAGLASEAHWLLEINPVSAKKQIVGFGNATKANVIATSPFKGSGHSVETLADAWMLAAYTRWAWLSTPSSFINLDIKLAPYPVETREEG